MSNNEEIAAEAVNRSAFTLYMFPFSLYSIMTRLTYAFGYSGLGNEKLGMRLKLVNLHRNENLSAYYLLVVNPKGQVKNTTTFSA